MNGKISGRGWQVAVTLVLLAGCLFLVQAGSASPTKVVKVEGRREGTIFIIEVHLSGPFSYEEVAAEKRVAVDLRGAVTSQKGMVFPSDPVVAAVRVQQNQSKPPVTRAVVDLKQPVSYRLSKKGETILVITLLDIEPPAASNSSLPAAPPLPSGIPAIDLHCDTLVNMLYPDKEASLAQGPFHINLAKMKRGNAVGQFFAIWTNARVIADGYTYANIMIDFFEQKVLPLYPEIALARSAQEFEANRMAGKISIFLSLEGSEPIRTLEDLDHFYRRGIRYIGITWNYQTLIADTAYPNRNNPPYGGLSPFGEEAVKRMNELGIIIDVSHASDETVRDVLALSTDPLLASHSCANHFRSHYRNLKDDLIVDICRGKGPGREGVIGVIFNASFLQQDKLNATVETVADHVEYIARLGGRECVALGSDYDGGIRPVRGLEDIGEIQNLAEVLRRRGWREEDLRKLYFGNVLRLLRQVVDAKMASLPPTFTAKTGGDE